jgi:hypothetical protein
VKNGPLAGKLTWFSLIERSIFFWRPQF